MQKEILVYKIKALGVHLSISLIIFCLILFFIYNYWYPQPFFSTDGGWQGIRLIIFVDLILGPTLTFVVFNPNKIRKLLTFDLSIIAICQIAALTWGIWAVHNERPYLIVFADGIFYPLTYYQIKDTGLTKNAIQQINPGKPPLKIYVDIPKDPQKYLDLLALATKTKPIHFMGNLYRPFDHNSMKSVSRYSINMQTYLKGESAAWMKEYQHFASTTDDMKNILFFNLHGRYGKYIVAFDSKTLAFRKVLNIPPPSIEEVIRGKEEAKKHPEKIQILPAK